MLYNRKITAFYCKVGDRDVMPDVLPKGMGATITPAIGMWGGVQERSYKAEIYTASSDEAIRALDMVISGFMKTEENEILIEVIYLPTGVSRASTVSRRNVNESRYYLGGIL